MPELLLLLATLLPPQHPADRDALLDGVGPLPQRGLPGSLAVTGDDATVVLCGGRDRPLPVVACARADEGRVFAVAHGAYLDPGFLRPEADGPEAQLWRNALAWATGGEGARRIVLLRAHPAHAAALREAGHEVHGGGLPDDLAAWDAVVLLNEPRLDDATVTRLQDFVRGGGAVLSAGCPWGWLQLKPDPTWTLADQGDDQVMAPFGLTYTALTAAPKDGEAYRADDWQPEEAHAGRVLAVLAGEGEVAHPGVVGDALQAVPPGSPFLERARQALGRFDARRAPTEAHPLRAKEEARDRLALVLAFRELRAAPVGERPAAPGAEAFPGAVPKRAERVTRTASFAPRPGWQPTGLYLGPGEPLTVEVVEGDPAGWTLRVGIHTDRLWHLASWKRWPEVTEAFPLAAGAFSTPFGGLLEMEAGRDAGPVTLRLAGAVEAPLFVLGDDDSAADWERLRAAPGPWAELVGDRLVLAFPSESVRDLEDPAAVVTFWDEVVRRQLELCGDPPLARPERFVPDVQISAGYMHAGHPIMTWMDVARPREGRPAVFLDLDELRTKGNWGAFHELGHNRQEPAWTFAGTGEVTNNLFSLYCGETMCGIEPWRNPWLEGQKEAGRKYLDEGADFARWTRHPGVALLTYAEVQHAFGWEPFRATFRAYHELPAAERPRTDEQKRDRWVKTLSLACGRDLRPFHAAWGWPLGDALLADPELAALPVWDADPRALLDQE